MIRRAITIALALSAGWLAAGCSEDPAAGYSLKSQYRQGIRTIHVPVWQRGRGVFRREIELALTEAIQKRIELDTPYKLTTRGRADTELTGVLESVDQQVLSVDPDSGAAREMELTLTVSFTWRDLRQNKKDVILVQKGNLKVTGTYVPHEPIGEEFFVGKEDVVNRLARRVVEHLEAPW